MQMRSFGQGQIRRHGCHQELADRLAGKPAQEQTVNVNDARD